MPRADRPTRTAGIAVTRISLSRRRLAQWMLVPAAQGLTLPAWAQAVPIASAPLWPAAEYTRVIVETNAPLSYQLHAVPAPSRLVLDIDNVDAGNELAQLPSR